jgi:hydroxyacylglutathione hydrolase
MTIHIIPILKDNYAYLIEMPERRAAIIDPGEAAPVIKILRELHLRPSCIINTHHHGDHVAGNQELSDLYAIPVYAPALDIPRIPGATQGLKGGDKLLLSIETNLHILATPGHTQNAISLYSPYHKAVFTGDTLFLMGCGRLMDGTAEQLYASLQALLQLPDDTRIYCGHEYTVSNALFAAHVEPENTDITARLKTVQDMRKRGEPTMPGTIGEEKRTNVFCRAVSTESFSDLRRQKDGFK